MSAAIFHLVGAKMPLARITIFIEKATLDRFFRAYPVKKRSQVIERLILQDLERRHDFLAKAAWDIETDPDFYTVRHDGDLWENVTGADGLDPY